MERTRRAEMKRQFDTVAKAALVNNIKVKVFRRNNILYKKKSFYLGIKKT